MHKYFKAHQEAENFLNNEKQYHLGMLPTEQPNPKTHDLDLRFAANAEDGVKMLLSVDLEVGEMAHRVMKGKEFKKMTDASTEAVLSGKKIVFSGCGATGRLSILLESMWRGFFRDMHQNCNDIYRKIKNIENSVFSIMTGGDYAFIRSVEFFEDYQEFGRQQAREMNIGPGDVLIAITEGGETSSVLGTVAESADRGASIFLLFNNPTEILVRHIHRSKKVIEDPRVTVLDLYCGQMAIAGSTRMQATTSELLVAGAALENILKESLAQLLSPEQLSITGIKVPDHAEAYKALLDELLSETNIRVIADYINMEKNIYRENGLVTYFANRFLTDIFTDTTERSPTFMLPPFRKHEDNVSPPPWAFVKDPLLPTTEAWVKILGRAPRYLDWGPELYRQMGASDLIISSPPLIGITQMLQFHIGKEDDDSRVSRIPNAAVNILSDRDISSREYNRYYEAFEKGSAKFQYKYTLAVGKETSPVNFRIGCSPAASCLNLMEHISIKLVLNTISTGTMVIMGRVNGNWMSYVAVTNKKLKDRGIRLISELCGISYSDACYALHETLEDFNRMDLKGSENISPVQYTVKKLYDYRQS
jgi:N-acetylmuramic acid 6-phosphate etherase